MVAAVFLDFGLGVVAAVETLPLVAGVMVLVFVAASHPRIATRVPPVGVAMVIGAALVIATEGVPAASGGDGAVFAVPLLQTPTFTWGATAELVVPLAITVLVVQNVQGMAVLETAGHEPPMRFATLACGVFSFPAAAVGAVSTCLAGPTNALLASSGARERQYCAGIVCGVTAIGFGVFSPPLIAALLAMPTAYVATLGGLALLKALTGAFSAAFSGDQVTPALATFLVTLSGVDVLGLGSAFWGLVTGSALVAVTAAVRRRAYGTLDAGADRLQPERADR